MPEITVSIWPWFAETSMVAVLSWDNVIPMTQKSARNL
jgi:hypothetical protein